jgi:hypothetical protein
MKLVARDMKIVLVKAGEAGGKRYGDSSDEGCCGACDRDMDMVLVKKAVVKEVAVEREISEDSSSWMQSTVQVHYTVHIYVLHLQDDTASRE